MKKGIITSLNGGIYTVYDLETKIEYSAKARGKLRHVELDEKSSFNKSNTRRSKVDKKIIKLSPKVGDYVDFELSEDDEGVNYIDSIQDRTNDILRPAVVNIDKTLLIFAAKEPDFSLNLLDRFLIHIEKSGITPVIVITKIDLLSDSELSSLKEELSYYESIGYNVYFTSSLNELHVEDVLKELDNNICILAGQTGAGKSSLLNAINPDFKIKTQEISKALGRGKHTTRHSTLHKFSNGFIADTPGFSSLEFGNMTKEDLSQCYPDFLEMGLECKFRGCLHLSEPGCVVKSSADTDSKLKRRYESYLKFQEQLKDVKLKY